MKTTLTLERFYVLPCCLLLLNLCNEIIAYKARLIDDAMVRTLFIIGLVLFGSSLVALVIAPGVVWAVHALRRTSRSQAGSLGGAAFLVGLGALIFWVYYRNYLLGTQSILPPAWRNGSH